MKSTRALISVVVAALTVAAAAPALAADARPYDPLTKGEARVILSDSSLAPTGFGATTANPFLAFRSQTPQVCWDANGNMTTLPKASVEYLKAYDLSRYSAPAATAIFSYGSAAKAQKAGRMLARMNCPNAANMRYEEGGPLVPVDQGGDQTDSLYGNLGYSTGYVYKEYNGKMFASLLAFRQVGKIVAVTSIVVPKAKATAGTTWAEATVDKAATAYHAKTYDGTAVGTGPESWAPVMVTAGTTSVDLVVGQTAVFPDDVPDARNPSYAATSSDPSVVTAFSTGSENAVPGFTGRSAGTAMVTVKASTGSVVQTVTVNVTPYTP